MKTLFPRRKFLKSTLTTGAAASGVLLSSWCAKVVAAISDPVSSQVFSHGVASGDPTHNSVVLWSRITANGRVNVAWQLASESSFTNILQQGESVTDAETDHTLKIEVNDLDPGQVYYYRFIVDGITSEPGRTRTLPNGPIENTN